MSARYVLTIDAGSADPLGRDPPYRVRLALKRLSRDFGLRCTDLRELGPGESFIIARLERETTQRELFDP